MNKFEGNIVLDNEYFNFDLELINDSTLDFDNIGSLSSEFIEDGLLFNYDFNSIDYLNFLSPVSGVNYSYPLSILPNPFLNKNYISLNGGFLQGYWKDILPLRTPEGFTLNYWMNFETTNTTSNTLNDTHPENKGYFFFMGTKSENLGGTTSDDVNGIGFFYRDNKLGYTNIIVRGEGEGNTTTSIRTESSPNIFTGTTENNWTNITVVYKRNEKLNICCEECDDPYKPAPIYFNGCDKVPYVVPAGVPDSQKGKLMFYVNGRPVFSTEIEEPIFRDLANPRGTTIPYNLSIGGGTQGLAESIPGLFMENNFAGSFNGGISRVMMYNRPLSVPELVKNFYALRDTYQRKENFGGVKIIVNSNLIK